MDKEKKINDLSEKEKASQEALAKALGKKIKLLRKEQDIKQDELAVKIGITQKELSRIETGNRKQFDIEFLVNIAQELNVHLDWLMANQGDKYILSKEQEEKIQAEGIALYKGKTREELILELYRKETKVEEMIYTIKDAIEKSKSR